MISPVSALITIALASSISVSTYAQNLPSERPAGCDGSSCKGCTPFQPPEGSAKQYPCGINDIYFPVPIYVIRNDTSATRELESRQWACFACCSLGCGFDDPQNTCQYTNYQWKEGAKYGCSKCAGKDVSVKGGEVKTSFADLSTESVYTTLVTQYGACAPADTVAPSPPVVMSPPPASPTMPPKMAPPKMEPPTMTPPKMAPPTMPPPTTPPPTTMTSPPASPPPSVVAPAQAAEVALSPAPTVEAAAPAPTEFVPIEIGSSTGPASSGGLMRGVSATMAAAAAAALL